MPSKTRIIGSVVALSLVTQLTACGTLFFPDRRGQIEGRIDPLVAALDAIHTKYEHLGKTVTFTGMNDATARFHGRLTGGLGNAH